MQDLFSDIGKLLIMTGISLVILGVLIVFSQRTGVSGWFGWFGNLPLDIRIEKENFRLYFPIGSSVLVSIILSLVLSIINKIFR